MIYVCSVVPLGDSTPEESDDEDEGPVIEDQEQIKIVISWWYSKSVSRDFGTPGVWAMSY